MKKILKKLTIFFITLILLFTLFVVAWVFFIFPRFVAPKEEVTESRFSPIEIANESEIIDFNESNGVLYVNNEIIVFIRDSTSEDKLSALLASFEAEIDESMSDINVYRLVLKKNMTYDDLESLIKKIESDPIVESAYLNTVTEFETDASDEEDNFDYKNPAYPDDPWNGDTWNVGVPCGENWGMEAIDAPGAWGYLGQMSPVRIGLIDTMPDLSHEDLSFANSSCLFVDEHTGTTEINKYTISADDHGTHVAGTMNAKWNNGTGSLNDGVSGVLGGKGELYYSKAYYVDNGKLVPKYDTAYSYLLALKTLIDQNVQVINISMNTSRLVGFAASHGNQNAINYLSMQASLAEKGLSRIIAAREAENKPDFVICVAAGNSNHIYYYKDDKAVYGYREEMTNWEMIKWIFGWRGEIGNSLALYNNFLSLMDAPEVKDRVIVVGAVGVDDEASTSNSTKYEYTYYSNVGSRVDIVAPGTQIYSCIVDGYGYDSGTSMATPHVSGVAGLIFACNSLLSGPDVKNILIASGTGRYYHGGEYSGLLNANNAVVKALETVKTPVEKVLKTEVDSGLDLCFLVDTTASMGDDIENAKENMENILEHLAGKTENYRVAIIDYRDYPERSNNSRDYPYKVQLSFTSNNELITDAITELDLGDGGDDKETVYSALMSAVELDWRSDAKKVIIILGDAAPLDPEPITGFAYDDVLLALFNADVNIDYEESDDRVVGALDTSLISIFSIGTDASPDAEDFFEDISSSTGGSYVNVEDASKVSNAIVDSIEQIEVDEKVTVRVDFGDIMANQKINLYNGEEYLFTIESDDNGEMIIDAIEADTYRWTSNGLFNGGLIDVDTDNRYATVRMIRDYWFTPLLQLWHQHNVFIYMVLVVYSAVCIIVPVLIKSICVHTRKRKFQIPIGTKSVPAPKNNDSDDDNSLCLNGSSHLIPRDQISLICGHSLNDTSTEYNICPQCANQCEKSAKYCCKCGAKLNSEIKNK